MQGYGSEKIEFFDKADQDLKILDGFLASVKLHYEDHGYDLEPNTFMFSATSSRHNPNIRRGPAPRGLKGWFQVMKQDFNREPYPPVVAYINTIKALDVWVINCTDITTMEEVENLKNVAKRALDNAAQRPFLVRAGKFGVGMDNPQVESYYSNL